MTAMVTATVVVAVGAVNKTAVTSNVALSPAHFKDLRRSGLNDETIAMMGCYSVPPAEINRLSPLLKPCESALAFPYPGVNSFHRYRIYPALDGMKYWQAPNTGVHLYILPSVA